MLPAIKTPDILKKIASFDTKLASELSELKVIHKTCDSCLLASVPKKYYVLVECDSKAQLTEKMRSAIRQPELDKTFKKLKNSNIFAKDGIAISVYQISDNLSFSDNIGDFLKTVSLANRILSTDLLILPSVATGVFKTELESFSGYFNLMFKLEVLKAISISDPEKSTDKSIPHIPSDSFICYPDSYLLTRISNSINSFRLNAGVDPKFNDFLSSKDLPTELLDLCKKKVKVTDVHQTYFFNLKNQAGFEEFSSSIDKGKSILHNLANYLILYFSLNPRLAEFVDIDFEQSLAFSSSKDSVFMFSYGIHPKYTRKSDNFFAKLSTDA